MMVASNVPMIKLGEYEIWRNRIEQYIQMIDYAQWDVIENGATLPKTEIMKGVITEMPITTAEEKAHRRLEASKACESVGASRRKVFTRKCSSKVIKSLSPKWNTHAVVWRNKTDLDTMSMDDLYNNLKVYEPQVKGMSSSCSSTQNMTFVSSLNNNTSSTNGAVNTTQAVNTAHEVSTAYSTNIDNLSDAVIFAFFASQPNSPQLVHEV
uniref:Uncharacterized protein n=1 Tax=Tanacetum cinerariifolium TaxID=118510 RepID=A0A6L2K1H5_TANCI|nr:hypothetical protein [Tanacetum cinerariifolium]